MSWFPRSHAREVPLPALGAGDAAAAAATAAGAECGSSSSSSAGALGPALRSEAARRRRRTREAGEGRWAARLRPPSAGMSISIPEGLTELLQGFTVEVLRSQPGDLLEFALQYFGRLKAAAAEKGGGGGSGAQGAAEDASGRCLNAASPGPARGSPLQCRGVSFVEEPMQTDSESGEGDDDDEAAFIGKGRRPLPFPPLQAHPSLAGGPPACSSPRSPVPSRCLATRGQAPALRADKKNSARFKTGRSQAGELPSPGVQNMPGGKMWQVGPPPEKPWPLEVTCRISEGLSRWAGWWWSFSPGSVEAFGVGQNPCGRLPGQFSVGQKGSRTVP